MAHYSKEAIASSNARDTSPAVTHAFEAPKWNQLDCVPVGRRTPHCPMVDVDNLHMVATMMQFLARRSSSDGGWTQLLPGKPGGAAWGEPAGSHSEPWSAAPQLTMAELAPYCMSKKGGA
ncbi:hypothetical protein VPH35_096727 [Triticum aestivum]|uniref:Uncharacterized protein n=2 Tax=Aegilops tauschii TaxID=37682 RepID=A0A453K7X8_AEGTS